MKRLCCDDAHVRPVRSRPGGKQSARWTFCVQMFPVLLKDVLTSAVGRLTAASVGSPRMNAELLLMFTLNCDRAYFFAHPERELTAEQQSRYEEALDQRARGIPSQYITGHQEFWGMDFIVTPAVLIPRPETEHIIETVLKLNDGGRASAAGSLPRIVDVGTGSGCIALALGKELPKADIHATDISSDALEVARVNAARHQLESRIHFHKPICCKVSIATCLILWYRILPTLANPKKTRCSSKSASLSRAMRSSQDPRA